MITWFHKVMAFPGCALFLAGCGGPAEPEAPAAVESKPFVFNPSIRMVAVDPGRYVRVTDIQQTITSRNDFGLGHEISHGVRVRDGQQSQLFKETLPVEKVKFDQAVEFCRALTLRDRKDGRIRWT